MKIANVKISWTRSPSADVTSRKIEVTKNGETVVIDLPVEASEYVLDVEAMGAVVVKTTVFDSEGLQATSDSYSFTLGDLEAPQPDGNFFHEVLSVRDDAPPAPPSP